MRFSGIVKGTKMKVITFCVITGVALLSWGSTLNMLTVILNDNDMPIVIEYAGHVDVVAGNTWRPAAESSAQLLWLADRFHYRFPRIDHLIPDTDAFKPAHWWLRALSYPTDGLLHAFSVGDVMSWCGSLLFLSLLPLLLIAIPHCVFANIRAGKSWRSDL